MKKLIAGNWKMNGALAANETLVRALVAGMAAARRAAAPGLAMGPGGNPGMR